MKKFLFMATMVSAAFTGCVNNHEAVLNSEDNPQPITFEVAKYKTSSRSEEATSTDSDKNYGELLSSDRFGTFAYEASSFHGNHTPFMENEQIGKVASYWTALGETYYWPETGHIDFISYYPYKQTNGDGTFPMGVPVISHKSTADDANDFNKLEFKDYTVGTENLMYSDKAHYQVHNYQTYFYSGVPTFFRHALAKLNFNVSAKIIESTEGTATVNWQVVVKSITLNNIYTKGTLTLTTNSPAAENGVYKPQTTEWVNSNTIANVWTNTSDVTTKEWTVVNGQTLHLQAAVFSDAKDYLVLPQSLFANTQSLTITYTIANKFSIHSTYNDSEEFTKTLYFKDYSDAGKVDAWEMGKNITYNIIIDPKGDVIYFDPAVNNWETEDRTMDI